MGSERPQMCRAPTFEHLPCFRLKNPKDRFAIYNDSKRLKKAVYKHKRMRRKETRKLGSQRGNYREKCSSPVSRSSGLKGLVAFWMSALMVSWVYFGPVSDLKYSILIFRLSQTVKSLAFWMPRDKI